LLCVCVRVSLRTPRLARGSRINPIDGLDVNAETEEKELLLGSNLVSTVPAFASDHICNLGTLNFGELRITIADDDQGGLFGDEGWLPSGENSFATTGHVQIKDDHSEAYPVIIDLLDTIIDGTNDSGKNSFELLPDQFSVELFVLGDDQDFLHQTELFGWSRTIHSMAVSFLVGGLKCRVCISVLPYNI